MPKCSSPNAENVTSNTLISQREANSPMRAMTCMAKEEKEYHDVVEVQTLRLASVSLGETLTYRRDEGRKIRCRLN